MKTSHSMPRSVRIVAALCFVIGVMAILDMVLKFFSRTLTFNFGVLFLYVGQRIHAWAESKWPESRRTRQTMNWPSGAAVLAGVIAIAATLTFPPFEKITREAFGAGDPFFQSFGRVISREFVGFHSFDWTAPEGGRAMMGLTNPFYDYSISLLQGEWFAIVSIVTIAVVCLRTTEVRPTATENRRLTETPVA